MDVFEPPEMGKLLRQVAGIQVQVVALNHGRHQADYVWTDPKGNIFQVERKHWAEIIGRIDSVEDQLDRTRSQAHSTYLLIEDLLVPSPDGAIGYTVEWTPQPRQGKPRHWFKTGRRYGESNGASTGVRPQPALYRRLVSWLDALDRSGITTIQAPTMGASAVRISQLYLNSQKEEFHAFQRYIKPQLPRGVKDSQVRLMMVFYGVGEITARSLIEVYDTVWNVLNADVEDLSFVVSRGVATDILKQVGKIT